MDRIDSLTTISSLAAYSEASSSSDEGKEPAPDVPQFESTEAPPTDKKDEDEDENPSDEAAKQVNSELKRTSMEIGGFISDEDDEASHQSGPPSVQPPSVSPPSPRQNSASPVSKPSVPGLARPQSLVANYQLEGEELSSSDSDESSALQSDDLSEIRRWKLSQSEGPSLSETVQHMDVSEIQIPPEPPGQCPRELQEKIRVMYDRVLNRGIDHNAEIQRHKGFRNPSIYEKLIEHVGIDEKGTNFPREIYDPKMWGPESFYDSLSKLQREEMEKREKEKKERTKIEFKTGTKKTDSGDKRRSKWDQSAGKQPNITVTTSTNLPTVSVTSSASGQKTTLISAIGQIKRQKTDK